MAKNFKDLTGLIFSRLTVIKEVDPVKSKRRYLCKCVCGKETIVFAYNLKNGTTKSCGCLNSEMASARRLIHGHSGTTEYWAYKNIKIRCYNKENKHYKNYGCRGICMCDHWLQRFDNFLNDVGCKPTPLHTIDRINSNGNYSCGHCVQCIQNGWTSNCRWAIREIQNNNTSRNVFVSYRGHRKTVAQWSKVLSIKERTLRNRLSSQNFTFDDIFASITTKP